MRVMLKEGGIAAQKGETCCTPEEVMRMAKKHHGLVYAMAAELGITHKTLCVYRQQWPEVDIAITEAKAGVLDSAESVVAAAVKRGEVGASMWLLRTLGKDRGYSERRENVVSGEVKVVHSGAVEVDVSTLSHDIAVALLDQLRAAKEKQDSTPLLEHKTLAGVGDVVTVPEQGITVKMGRKRDKNTREGKGIE